MTIDKVSMQITVSARTAQQLAVFKKFCETIESLGNMGSTRTLALEVDGDGSGQMWFEYYNNSEVLPELFTHPRNGYDEGPIYIGSIE